MMKCMARARVCDLEFGHDGKCAVAEQPMQYRTLPEASTAKERRRYALLAAAMAYFSTRDHAAAPFATVVTNSVECAEALLAEIEKRETKC